MRTLGGKTTKEINSNFKIKVSGVRDGQKYNLLVGVSGLINIVGEELGANMVRKAFKSIGDKKENKLRTGLVVTFYTY